ncbi:extracellular solute-binding protein [Orenia marismortui]|uniref:extracellular solute-binding protein n=1 Tax=Orenia marismortui TaxID=46469 RepID=UPI000374BBEA|nr:extracellular solute-binding protein [Orenia marismortui]
MKKSISSILIIVLALSLLLVGCASNEEAQKPTEEKKQTEEVAEKAKGLDLREVKEPVTIKFWEMAYPKVDETLDSLIAEFEKANPNITVERTHMETEDLRQNTQTAFMGGKGPDVVRSPFDHVGPFSIMGIAQPLDDLMSDEMKNMYLDNALPGMTLNGSVYGVPDTMGNHLTLLYNKDLVKEVPQTWEELIAMAKDLTVDKDSDGKPDQYGLVYNLNEPFWWVVFHGGFGGWVFDENNNPTLDTEATKDAMQFVKDLKFKHNIVPDECDYNLADSLFVEGKAAFAINGDWSYGKYLEADTVDLGVAPLPKFKKTGKYAQPMTSGTGLIMISELPENKKIAVMKFIKFMTSKDSQKELVVKHKVLPSNASVYDLPIITEDPVMQGSAAQLKNGKAMPIIPEMRAIWDAIRPVLQSVMAGDLDPAQAPAKMQETAEKKISEMQ